jgi:hypothetical protein
MHYLVRVIVEAEDAKEANNHAECVLNDLLEWKEFDWYSTSTDESRWEHCWKPVRLDSNKGQAWVKDAMKSQLDEFVRTMQTVRLMVRDYSDEQIFNEEFEQVDGHYLSRYQFSRASGYHGNACQLFDTNGSSITSQKELDSYLKEPNGLWVVQVDCHN